MMTGPVKLAFDLTADNQWDYAGFEDSREIDGTQATTNYLSPGDTRYWITVKLPLLPKGKIRLTATVDEE